MVVTGPLEELTFITIFFMQNYPRLLKMFPSFLIFQTKLVEASKMYNGKWFCT